MPETLYSSRLLAFLLFINVKDGRIACLLYVVRSNNIPVIECAYNSDKYCVFRINEKSKLLLVLLNACLIIKIYLKMYYCKMQLCMCLIFLHACMCNICKKYDYLSLVNSIFSVAEMMRVNVSPSNS